MFNAAATRPGIRFQLKDFEGPLDLLLFLISENELDIWDIPIVAITRQYQDWMNDIGELDLEDAGDYILMSATLLHIKARLLLPREDEEADEVEDPRRELALRLLDYQRLRELSQGLGRLEERGASIWLRGWSAMDLVEPGLRDDSLRAVSLYDLGRCYAELVARPERPRHHHVELFPLTVEDQIRAIREQLTRRQVMPLSGLEGGERDRPRHIISFLAVLDMMRQREVIARQTRTSGDLWLFPPRRQHQWLKELRDLAE
ncbi:MAG: segregation/condensation protein A [bacterium]|jgi:segregation and condensation protein A|nr:segregation/condensation protein A [bacterium]